MKLTFIFFVTRLEQGQMKKLVAHQTVIKNVKDKEIRYKIIEFGSANAKLKSTKCQPTRVKWT